MNDEKLPDGVIRTPEGFYVLERDSHLSRWVEERKALDIASEEISVFAKHIPKGGVVIDAGASLGDHTATYAKLVGPNGRVFAFEPHPVTYQALALNFKDTINVFTFNAALSANGLPTRLLLSPNIGASCVDVNGDVPIQTVTLDNFLYCALQHSFRKLDFCHFDCEGTEVNVLLGGQELIMAHKPAIVLEINHGALARYGWTEADVQKVLAGFGYETSELHADNGPHLPQRDILALPKQ